MSAGRSVRDALLTLDPELAATILRMESRVTPARADLLLEWMGDLRIARGLSPRTLTRYVKHALEFDQWLTAQSIELEAVTYRDLERWSRDLFLVKNLAERTRRVAVASVRRLFAWIEQTTGRASPARHLPSPRISKRVPRRYSAKDLARLLAVCDVSTLKGARDYAVMLMLYATGLRREEMADLSLHALEMGQRVASVRIEGKGAKERVVSFEGPSVLALQTWLAMREQMTIHDKDAVWVSVGRSAGARLSYRGIDNLVTAAAQRAGMAEWGVHRFRVTFASDLYDEGADIETIRRLLGHEDVRTTQGYLDTSRKRQKSRLPARLQARVAGKKGGGLPLWVQEKLQKGTDL